MSDPFDGLEEWAKQAERRAKRADRRRRLGLMFRFRRPRPGLRRWRPPAIAWVAGIVIVVFLLAAAVQAYLPGGSPAGSSAGSSAYATQAVPSGVSATTSASAAPTDPFEGTPAATYPKGEAGITMPPATAVTGFTAAQVDAALQQVRKALVAGRLDQKMLVGHDPSTLLALLAPNPAKHVKAWFDDASFSSVATWIDPAAHLDPDEEVRVSGRVTLGSAVVEGIQTLQVTTNFVWVYAFTGNARNPLAAVHDQIRWDFPATGRLRAADKGMWIGDIHSYLAQIDCAAARKGLLAPFRAGSGAPAANPSDTEDPDAYLRADHSLDIADDCHLSTPTPAPGA
ncbi:hypothetical protein ACFPIJ_62585 [Dactylosporangium cerinum]|uniref:Uncharacterized protein n=1 Tax=Dactylosporangium cerinum TaxID=1434730 RepID=A0ABV9WLH9_9ACTN